MSGGAVLRVGLLGAGRVGTLHAGVIASHAGSRLVAVHDPDPAFGEALAQAHGVEHAQQAEHLIASPDVDAVLVATRTDTHCELIEACVQAGKPVLCEKPLDLDAGRVSRCASVLRAQPQHHVQVGFNRRFDAAFIELREQAAQRVGRIEQVHIIGRVPKPPPYRYVHDSGGLFCDMTIHDFDLLRFLTGDEVVAVSAHGAALVDPALAAHGDIDTAMVTLELAGGVLATITNGRRCAYGFDHRVEIFGSQGMVCVQNGAQGLVRHFSAEGTDAGPLLRDSPIFGYLHTFQAQWEAFVISVRHGTRSGAGFADGWAALSLALSAREALASGRRVDPRPLRAAIALSAPP